MAKLINELKRAIASAHSLIWLSSSEAEDALTTISDVCEEQQWIMLTWDPEYGLRTEKDTEPVRATADKPADPIAAIMELQKLDTDETRAVLVLRNFTPYLSSREGTVGNPVLLQVLQTAVEEGAKESRCIIILTYDHIAIPRELEKMLYQIDHDFPDAKELYELMDSVSDEGKLPAKTSPEAKVLCDAAAGLTRLEALGAFSLSLAEHGDIKPDTLWDLKAKMLQKTGILEMLTRQQVTDKDELTGFKSLGGLEVLKAFCKNMFNSPNRGKHVRPLGTMLLGPSGTGKSAFAVSLGNEVGLPTIRLDPGKLMGSLVGESEAATRRALKTIDAMSPCLLFID